jgi:hypothetical protein
VTTRLLADVPAVGLPFLADVPAVGLLAELGGLATLMTLALVVVLAGAGLLKIRRPATTEIAALGLPAPRLLAATVPPVELGVAALLVVRPRWGAMAAVPLLVAFTVVIVRTIRSGRSVSCGCLGGLSSRPVSATALVRNGFLLVLALAAATLPGLAMPDLVSLSAFVGFVLIVALASQLLGLWQTTGHLWSVQLAGEPRRRSSSRRTS